MECCECRKMRMQSEGQSCCCGIPSILGTRLIDAIIFGYALAGIVNVIFASVNKYIDSCYPIASLFIFLPLTCCAFASFCCSKSSSRLGRRFLFFTCILTIVTAVAFLGWTIYYYTNLYSYPVAYSGWGDDSGYSR